MAWHGALLSTATYVPELRSCSSDAQPGITRRLCFVAQSSSSPGLKQSTVQYEEGEEEVTLSDDDEMSLQSNNVMQDASFRNWI